MSQQQGQAYSKEASWHKVEEPSTKTKHSAACSTVFLRSIYDKSCPRCVQINKVIQLRRKSISNGASYNEAVQATELAARLAEKYNLMPAELVDRIYASPTNTEAPARAAEKRAKRTREEKYV